MKKKQSRSYYLAALLSVSPAVEGAAVMGADFSSGKKQWKLCRNRQKLKIRHGKRSN
ncbi:MAG: hypothetical protein ACLRH0_06075 [Blautia wexlerae]